MFAAANKCVYIVNLCICFCFVVLPDPLSQLVLRIWHIIFFCVIKCNKTKKRDRRMDIESDRKKWLAITTK